MPTQTFTFEETESAILVGGLIAFAAGLIIGALIASLVWWVI